VHSHKEIENYLIVPEAIRKAVWRKVKVREPDAAEFTIDDALGWLKKATEPLKTSVMSQRLARVLQYEKDHGSPLDPSTIIGRYTDKFESEWNDINERFKRVPGKEVLARLNELLQTVARVSLTEVMIVEQISRFTVDPDLLGTLEILDQFCTD
jgi:hypothetical protein